MSREPLVRKPEWLKVTLPTGQQAKVIRGLLNEHRLNTVCESAACPNRGECWTKGTATFMILGNTCTRACGFCNIKVGKAEQVDLQEPLGVAQSVKDMGLSHVVVTSVARDDLPDEGAGHFAKTILAIRDLSPTTTIEVLIPDFNGREDLLQIVLDAKPNILNHNVETVGRLSPTVRHRAKHNRSLQLLQRTKEYNPTLWTKSGIMVGLGEQFQEVIDTFSELRQSKVDILTVGQYLQPTREHLAVQEFIHPDTFKAWEESARGMGFSWVSCSPLVRSSYNAEDFYQHQLGHQKTIQPDTI